MLNTALLVASELRASARLARRQAGFTALLVGILALAIGSSVAMFSVLNAVVLRPLPFHDPDRLMWLTSTRPDGSRGPFSIQDYVDLRERNVGASGLAAFANWSANLTGLGTAERIQAARASANAFAVLGVNAFTGRSFEPADGVNGRVVLLTHNLWSRRFGGDLALIGRSLTLNDASYTVVGVLPPEFVSPIRDAELIVPLVEADARRVEGEVNFLRFVARLAPGVTPAQAAGALAATARELRALRPQTNARKAGIGVTPLHEQIVGDYAATLRLLVGAVLLVLLLACVNLASLSLARAAGRRRELAVRAALGVGRRRLALQLLMEPVVPTLAAGAAGTLLAAWETRALLALAPAAMPRAAAASLDARVLAFAFVTTIVTAIGVGAWPALRASRVEPADDLRGGRAGSGGSLRLRRALVAVEVAISLVLAVSTAFFVQSLRRVQQIDPGFSTDNVLSMRLALSADRYPNLASVLAFQNRLESRLRALPDVQQVGGANLIPLSGLTATVDFVVEGRAFRRDEVPEAEYRATSPGFFSTMGIKLLAGRGFTDQDATSSPGVAVVNKTLAERFFPGRSAVGEHLHIEPGGRLLDRVVEIVGVVGDVKHYGLDGRSTLDIYIPFPQLAESSVVWIRNNQFWVIRTSRPPLQLAAAARAALAEADPDVPAAAVRTLEQAIDGSLTVRRFNATVVAVFGYAALLLTACGIYAVSAQTVAARARELGIRAALGAPPRGLVRLVLATDFGAIGVGLAVGALAARAAAGEFSRWLFDVRPGEPAVYLAVSSALAAVGAIACLVPASRAAKADPLKVLAAE